MSHDIKKKLDLNNLLAKYESGNKGYSATHHNDFYETNRQAPIEEEFYNTNSYFKDQNANSRSRYQQPQNQEPLFERKVQTSTQSFKGNFQMSKQQCETFLLKVLAELDSEKKQLNFHGQRALKQISERFSRNHEIIKKEILELLDKAFRENQKNIREELFKHSKEQPVQFQRVYREIREVNSQIQDYLRMLGGNEYRKAISEVVLKDYSYEVTRLRETIKDAKQEYLESLGEVEPDRTRIQCLRSDLKGLFYFKKKTAKVVEKSIFEVLGGNNGNLSIPPPQRQSSPEKKTSHIFQQDASRTRKSFFNFGGS